MKRLQKHEISLPLWLGIPVLLFVTLLLGITLGSGRGQTAQTAPGLVTAQQAAVYSEADEAAATIYAVPHNTVFTVLEQKDGWYYTCIKHEEGLYGWLKASDVTLPGKMTCNGISGPSSATGILLGNAENMAPEADVPTGTVRLYAGPGRVYGTVDKVALGTPVQVVSYEDGWFCVTGSDLEGYVPADALLLDVNPFIIQEENEGEDEQQDEESTTPDDGQQNEENTTPDDGNMDETSTTPDDNKDDESTTPDNNQQSEQPVQPTVNLPASSTKVLAAGVVNSSGLRLRKGPGTDHAIITEMSKGTPVAVLGWENGWYKVNCGGQVGYASQDYLKVYPSTDSLTGYAMVNTDALNMRSKASTSGSILKVLEDGDCVALKGFENGWFKVDADGTVGYVSGDYVTLRLTKPAEPTPETNNGGTSQQPSGGSTSQQPSGGTTPPPSTGSGVGADIAAYAQTFIGVPYVYGGATPSGFDCSGFVQYVYKHFGYSLPRGSNDQYRKGTAVSKSELQPGDLIFFDNGTGTPTSHVGIYIGGGKMVHSTEYNYGNGKWVKGVQIHALSNAWYSKIYLGSRRIVG